MLKEEPPNAAERLLESFRAAAEEFQCEWDEAEFNRVMRQLLNAKPG
jgi:hypothetical protein